MSSPGHQLAANLRTNEERLGDSHRRFFDEYCKPRGHVHDAYDVVVCAEEVLAARLLQSRGYHITPPDTPDAGLGVDS